MQHIPTAWRNALGPEIPAMADACFLNAYRVDASQHTVYPPEELVYRALELTPPDKVKVLIIGQDPYTKQGQANGMAFSVPNGTKLPPSLRNIFAELQADLGITRTDSDLSDWAEQGVLLLNSGLTVREKSPGSHQHIGWSFVTRAIVSHCLAQESPLAIILWGKHAEEMAASCPDAAFHRLMPNMETCPASIHAQPVWTGITTHDNGATHEFLFSPHPSPLSSYRGFFGSKPFSWANRCLEKGGAEPIRW